MEYFLSNRNVRVPKLIYGTAWKKDRTKNLVLDALANGFDGFDTACQPKHYNEVGVGEALKIALSSGYERENLFVQTKFTPIDGQDPNNIPYDPDSSLEEQVKASIERSLKNLNIEYIDSLVLHSPYSEMADTMRVWSVMEEFVEDYRVRQLGISNCYDLMTFRYLYEKSEIKPSVLQNRFYFDSDYDVELREFCRENDVIYQSFWTLSANPQILQSEAVLELSKKLNRSPEQILYRYLNQRGVAPLCGTTSKEHMKEDIGIFDFKLNEMSLLIMDAFFQRCVEF